MLKTLVAHATPPPSARVTRTIPTDGARYPANAAIMVFGGHQTAAGVTATVDGAPANVVLASDLPKVGGVVALRVQPEPPVGASVTIQGDFCGPSGGCDASLRFVAGPPDNMAPPPVEHLSFDVDDTLLGAQRPSDAPFRLIDWHVQLVAAKADYRSEAARLYVVEGTRRDDPERVIASRSTLEPQFPLWFQPPAELPSSVDAGEAACFDVTVVDAAGNRSAPSGKLCHACHVRRGQRAFKQKDKWSTPGVFDVENSDTCPPDTWTLTRMFLIVAVPLVTLALAIPLFRRWRALRRG